MAAITLTDAAYAFLRSPYFIREKRFVDQVQKVATAAAIVLAMAGCASGGGDSCASLMAADVTSKGANGTSTV